MCTGARRRSCSPATSTARPGRPSTGPTVRQRPAGAASLTLDFTAVPYINSTGIALIVGLLGRARGADVPVTARGLTDHYREIFEITRLSDFMTIEAGATAAPEGSTR